MSSKTAKQNDDGSKPRKCNYCLKDFPSNTKFHHHMPCPNKPYEPYPYRRWSRPSNDTYETMFFALNGGRN